MQFIVSYFVEQNFCCILKSLRLVLAFFCVVDATHDLIEIHIAKFTSFGWCGIILCEERATNLGIQRLLCVESRFLER